jgi:hypothetical protein
MLYLGVAPAASAAGQAGVCVRVSLSLSLSVAENESGGAGLLAGSDVVDERCLRSIIAWNSDL